MSGVFATARLESSFSEASRHNRRSNRIRTKTLPKRQDFVLEPLESRLPRIACPPPSLFKVVGVALIFCLLGCPLGLVFAQNLGNIDPTQNLDWAPGAI